MKHNLKYKILVLAFFMLFCENIFAQWQYNGNDIFYNDGKVGIGTTSPIGKLHLYNNNNQTFTLERSDGLTGQDISFIDAAGTNTLSVYCGVEGYVDFFGKMRLLNNGFLGIGTQNPNAKLHLYTDGLIGLNIERGGTGFGNQIAFNDVNGTSTLTVFNGETGYMDFNSKMRILNEGKIGIGIENPQYTFDVNGTINATDILKSGLSIIKWNDGLYNNQIYYNDGTVGIGTNNPGWPLHIMNSSSIWKAMFGSTIDGTGIAFMDANGLGWINYYGGANGYMDFFNKFRITNNGNIGINNANPNYKLDVGGIINATDFLKNGQAFGLWSVNVQNLYYNNGNIGIGTDNPSEKLEVNGIIKNSSDINVYPLRFATTSDNNWGIEHQPQFTNKNSLNSEEFFGIGIRMVDNINSGFYVKDVVTGLKRFVVGRNGKVGINTENPDFTLDVNGTVNATEIYKNGQPFTTSQWTTNGNNIFYNNGNVGINTNNPFEQLQIGDRFVFHNGGQKIIGYNFHYDGLDKRILQAPVSNLCLRDDGSVLFRTAPSDAAGSVINWTNSFLINNEGRVCIGMTTPYLIYYNYPATLSVNGSIVSKEIHVRINGWPDFVFKKGYKLKTLDEVEKYINENGHLEGIPDENEVKENGIELGNTTTILLQKIEELTLYVIELKKEIKELNEKIISK
jgi:hypothetical protein